MCKFPQSRVHKVDFRELPPRCAHPDEVLRGYVKFAPAVAGRKTPQRMRILTLQAEDLPTSRRASAARKLIERRPIYA